MRMRLINSGRGVLLFVGLQCGEKNRQMPKVGGLKSCTQSMHAQQLEGYGTYLRLFATSVLTLVVKSLPDNSAIFITF